MKPLALPQIPLHDDRVWRGLLGLLFVAAILVRYLAYDQLSQHPVGRMESWPETPSWFFQRLAETMVLDADWKLARVGTLQVHPSTAGLAPLPDWAAWSGGRLPRGAPFLYLAAVSFSLTGTLFLYTLAALLAGGATAVVGALAATQLFASRGAGLIAGLLIASSLPLVVATVAPGPWIWEALALLTLVWSVARLRGENRGPGDWLLVGLVLALAVMVRSFFVWGLIVVPAVALAGRWRVGIACWAALLFSVLLALGALAARNHAVGGSIVPLVGQPAWDIARTTHRGVHSHLVPPAEVELMEATGGRLPKVLERLATRERAVLLLAIPVKLRCFLGARDEAFSPGVNVEYLRRRAEALRLLCLRSDGTMAMAWAGFAFLLWRRRLPGGLLAVLALLVLHGVLFDPTGLNRSMLHAVGALLAAGALVDAARHYKGAPTGPLVLLLLYAACLWLLAVDDHARGSRYRQDEFAWAAREFVREGRAPAAERERRDYHAIRRQEQLLGGFWNAPR